MKSHGIEDMQNHERRIGQEFDSQPAEVLAANEFSLIAEFLAEEYDYPELKKAELVFVEGDMYTGAPKHEKDVTPFYLKQYDSRSLKFEFDKSKHEAFRRAFKDIYSDTELTNLGLDRIATMLYVGCGLVRPVTEYEFFRKHAPLKSQHAHTVRNVYSSRSDLENFFEDMFGIDASGPMHAQLINEIPDKEVMPINTVRIALSFLYGGMRRDADKIMLGELMRTSRDFLYDYVVNNRGDFQHIAVTGHGDEGVKKGDWLFLDTIPGWILAFACPIKPESYGKLSEKFWQDKFSIKGASDMKTIADGLGTMCVDKPVLDTPVSWAPSAK